MIESKQKTQNKSKLPTLMQKKKTTVPKEFSFATDKLRQSRSAKENASNCNNSSEDSSSIKKESSLPRIQRNSLKSTNRIKTVSSSNREPIIQVQNSIQVQSKNQVNVPRLLSTSSQSQRNSVLKQVERPRIAIEESKKDHGRYQSSVSTQHRSEADTKNSDEKPLSKLERRITQHFQNKKSTSSQSKQIPTRQPAFTQIQRKDREIVEKFTKTIIDIKNTPKKTSSIQSQSSSESQTNYDNCHQVVQQTSVKTEQQAIDILSQLSMKYSQSTVKSDTHTNNTPKASILNNIKTAQENEIISVTEKDQAKELPLVLQLSREEQLKLIQKETDDQTINIGGLELIQSTTQQEDNSAYSKKLRDLKKKHSDMFSIDNSISKESGFIRKDQSEMITTFIDQDDTCQLFFDSSLNQNSKQIKLKNLWDNQ